MSEIPDTPHNHDTQPAGHYFDVSKEFYELRLWTPHNIGYDPYDGDPAAYVSNIRRAYGVITNGYGAEITDVPSFEEDAKSLARGWLSEHRLRLRSIVPTVGVPYEPLRRQFRSQLTDTICAASAVPEIEARLRFTEACNAIVASVVQTEMTGREVRNRPIQFSDIGAMAVQNINGQMAALDIRAAAQPFFSLPLEHQQDIVGVFGDDLIGFWSLAHTHDLEVVAEAHLPTLREEYDGLPRILESASNSRDVMRLYLNNPAAYAKLVSRAVYYEGFSPEELESTAAQLGVGQQMALHTGDLIPKEQLFRLFDKASRAIAADIYSAYNAPKFMRVSRWDGVNGNVVEKLVKNFNGKVTNVRLERLEVDEAAMDRTFRKVEPPEDMQDVRRYILTADMKSSGRAAVPSGVEFVIYYRKNLMFRMARKPASGQKALDAMVAEAKDNARIIEIENIEQAGSAGAPSLGKRR